MPEPTERFEEVLYEIRDLLRELRDLHRQPVRQANGPEPVNLSIPAAADRLSVSPRTIRRLIQRGQLRPIRIGERTLIPTAQVDAFVRERARGRAAR